MNFIKRLALLLLVPVFVYAQGFPGGNGDGDTGGGNFPGEPSSIVQLGNSDTQIRATNPLVTEYCNFDGSACVGTAGVGDVVGPAVAVDNNLAAFDSTTGKLIKDSGLLTANILTTSSTVSSLTTLGILTTLTVDDITINGNTLSSAGASTLAIDPTAGQVITFDGTVTLDAGVIAGATSISSTTFVGALTGAASGNLVDVVDDTTPELGGEMDAGAFSIGFTAQSATGDGTTTIDWGLGNKFNFQFGAFNETFTFTDPANPGNFILKLVQDSVGSRTATWPASVKWSGGTAPTLTTTADTGTDIIALYFDGTNYFSGATLDLQ